MRGERPWRPLASSGIQGKHAPQEGPPPRCSQLPLGIGGFGGLEDSDSVEVCPGCGHPICGYRQGLCSSGCPPWSRPGFLNLSTIDIFGLGNPFVETVLCTVGIK